MIQIPVPAVESATSGLKTTLVCPHVTVLGPFVDRSDVDEELVTTIRGVLAPIHAFEFELTRAGSFAGGLVYLAPDPAEPFIRLTELLAEAFPQWPPYGGAFDEIVPHLSVGENLDDEDRTTLQQLLPIRAAADEVTLTWWSERTAEVLARFPLRSDFPSTGV